MTRPIKETPVLTGQDAKKFAEEMAKPKSYTREEMEAMKNARRVCERSHVLV
jgi:hypothetical protein